MSAPILTARPYIYSVARADGTPVFRSHVKRDGKVIYLASRLSRAEALAVALDFIATGVRPPPQRRGPKRGQVMRLVRRGLPVPRKEPPAPPAPVVPLVPSTQPQPDRQELWRRIVRKYATA